MKNRLVFTGSYTQPLKLGTGQIAEASGEGVCVYRMGEDGTLKKLFSGGKPNPSYLAVDGRVLYTVNELKECEGMPSSAVSSYRLDPQSGELGFKSRQLTWGEDACHVTLAPGGALLAANYTGGSVCVFPTGDNGEIGRMSCFFQHRGRSVHPIRQQGPHAHQAVADKSGGHVLVADLGLDEVCVYGADWENGHLIPDKAKAIRVAPRMGPRQCVFNEAGTRLYVLCELGNAVCAYDYDSRTGGARLLQTLSTLPLGCEAESIAACLKLHPNGKLLFASNRGHDSIAAYHVDESGLLALVRVVSSGGRTPRDFDISPDGEFLIAGNQESDELVIFRIESENGGLKEIGRQHCGSVTAVLITDIEE